MTLIDACYLHGGIGRPPTPRRRASATVTPYAGPSASAPSTRHRHARVGAAIHSIRAVDPDSAAIVAAWARERGAPLHAHVSEQPAENEACRDAYGDTPTGVLDRAGAVSGHFTAIHATHVTDADTATLGAASAFCCLCPTTERDLADGVGPAARLRDDGALLALGSDSHAIIEPLEEARAVELDERLVSGERGRHAADDLLYAATAGGYASVGWPEGGMIRAGALADLVAFDLTGVRLAGTPDDRLVDGLVFAGAAADVRDVVVGGRFVVRDGQHVTIDVPGELESAIRDVTR